MNTKTHKAFGGAVVFTMQPRTPKTRLDKDRIMAELKTEDRLLRAFYTELVYLVCNTTDIEAHEPLESVGEFWQMVQDGTAPDEWCEWFVTNVHEAVYEEWVVAYENANRLVVNPVEAAPELLTPEQAADPK